MKKLYEGIMYTWKIVPAEHVAVIKVLTALLVVLNALRASDMYCLTSDVGLNYSDTHEYISKIT